MNKILVQKVLCKWSIINYNSINTGPSQNIKIFSEVVVGCKCGAIAKIEKQAFS